MILTGSVRFLGLGRLENNPPLDGRGSESSLVLLFPAEGFALGSLLAAAPAFFGSGSTEKSPLDLGLLSAAAEVEVSSESLSSLLPYATKDMFAGITEGEMSAETREHG